MRIILTLLKYSSFNVFKKIGGFDTSFVSAEDWDLDKRIRNEGKTVFMIEHKIKFAEAISNHLFKIENYKIEKLN